LPGVTVTERVVGTDLRDTLTLEERPGPGPDGPATPQATIPKGASSARTTRQLLRHMAVLLLAVDGGTAGGISLDPDANARLAEAKDS
jgi:hypothetical protein